MDIWIAGIETDPNDPMANEIYATRDRKQAYEWLVNSVEYADTALAVYETYAKDPEWGFVGRWFEPDSGDQITAFVRRTQLFGDLAPNPYVSKEA